MVMGSCNVRFIVVHCWNVDIHLFYCNLGWGYLDSLYYSFTTLTTIGFGDYVALQQDNALEKKIHYVVLVISFILFGLAIIAAALNLMVLKLMTLNTEDEKRDEEQAMQVKITYKYYWKLIS